MSTPVVLLTGASGLVGTWLRRTVPRGVELVSLTHRTSVSDPAFVTADLRDPQAVAEALGRVRPSMVIHAAWRLDEPSIVDATRNVVDGASTAGAEFVHLSTDVVFSGDGRPVDERSRPDPVSDHGRWKAQAEVIVGDARVPSCVVRLPLVLSLDPMDQSTERLRAGALEGRPTSWFSDEFRRPAMAADIADGLWRIASLSTEQRSGVWHLGGPELLSRSEIACRTADALGLDRSSIVAEPTPPGVVRPRHIDMHSRRARDEIGWDPTPVLT
jgi:dTDP-4-dehydrorhamnose reductase